ncbi:restriction endonuclease subunit S [Anaerofustis butyriciformans]|uniref:restriction endonuclease subunit S n=1 Tax=Anaerofustis butyriciformans TaxID=3108533 RepID=UPI003F89457B
MAMIRPETEMKDSGVQWIGDIPSDWNIKPLYACLDEINQKNNPVVTTNILSLTNTDGVIPYSERGNQGNKSKENFEEYKVVYPNTIVANSMNILIGSVGLSKYEGCVSPVYYVYMAKPQVDIRYMNYLFQMEPFQKRLRQFANGILEIRLRVSSHDILHQKVAVPDYDEQQTIADYLDETCSKIDEIIAEAKASIDEYKELRLSVLTSATTKGLSNDVKYKDSGSRWVDEIPSDWSKMKIHYIIDMPVIDGPHVSPELVSEGVNYISANAIVDGKIDFNKRRGYITREYSNECRKRYSPQKNDILVVKLGASTGKMAMVGDFTDFDIWVPIAVVRCKKEVNAKYVYYSMSSKYFKDEIKDGWTFGTQETLGVKTLESLYIFLPSRVEQDEIVRYLDEQLPKYDSLIAEKESLINDLEAYKKSLIYEVVTGKRRVV